MISFAAHEETIDLAMQNGINLVALLFNDLIKRAVSARVKFTESGAMRFIKFYASLKFYAFYAALKFAIQNFRSKFTAKFHGKSAIKRAKAEPCE